MMEQGIQMTEINVFHQKKNHRAVFGKVFCILQAIKAD
jgi:hypothetical protein